MQQTAAPNSPRAYARLVLACLNEAERTAVYRRCPEDWHGIVKRHVEIAEQRRASFVKERESFKPKPPPAGPKTVGYIEPPLSKRSSPAVANQHLAAARAAIRGDASCH